PQRYGAQVGVATGILGAAGGLGGFLLPTLLGGLKQAVGSYAAGLTAFAGMAALALVCLVIAQRQWVGNWIAEHGRVDSGALTTAPITNRVFDEASKAARSGACAPSEAA